MLTLRDINRALDRLGTEAFIPQTVRRPDLRPIAVAGCDRHATCDDRPLMNALQALAALIGRWRLRRIAKRRLRRLIRHDEIVAPLVPLAPMRRAVVIVDRRSVMLTRSGRFASRSARQKR